jgi:hypothetical protein
MHVTARYPNGSWRGPRPTWRSRWPKDADGYAASHPSLLAADASFIRALHYHAPLGGYRCQRSRVRISCSDRGGLSESQSLMAATTVAECWTCLTRHARATTSRCRDLPAGEMFQPGCTHPELHVRQPHVPAAQVKLSGEPPEVPRHVCQRPRFIRSVTVPPVHRCGHYHHPLKGVSWLQRSERKC